MAMSLDETHVPSSKRPKSSVKSRSCSTNTGKFHTLHYFLGSRPSPNPAQDQISASRSILKTQIRTLRTKAQSQDLKPMPQLQIPASIPKYYQQVKPQILVSWPKSQQKDNFQLQVKNPFRSFKSWPQGQSPSHKV